VATVDESGQQTVVMIDVLARSPRQNRTHFKVDHADGTLGFDEVGKVFLLDQGVLEARQSEKGRFDCSFHQRKYY
jgi:hypothetical protein